MNYCSLAKTKWHKHDMPDETCCLTRKVCLIRAQAFVTLLLRLSSFLFLFDSPLKVLNRLSRILHRPLRLLLFLSSLPSPLKALASPLKACIASKALASPLKACFASQGLLRLSRLLHRLSRLLLRLSRLAPPLKALASDLKLSHHPSSFFALASPIKLLCALASPWEALASPVKLLRALASPLKLLVVISIVLHVLDWILFEISFVSS
ncbi:hypothetical protein F2Q68_00008252 [Brassica cretica]|uniref:Transmembrane protein n=1 Tax=Brassica cretica TaxID=69181 RepID=A0A8S9KYL2_BRACR|nr:hypothetical protein F2Q68_00008252 [Brassica cretica]